MQSSDIGARVLNIQFSPQTEAYVEGGLKEIWAFAKNNQYLLGIFTAVLINVLSNQINIDRELINLQKESLRLEICQRSFQSEPFSVVKSEPPCPYDWLNSTPSFPTFPRSL
jgi:hypothetical protein